MAPIMVSLLLLVVAQPRVDSVRVQKLACGLRVVAVEDRALALVSVQLWFRAGSRHDPEALPGLTRMAHRFLSYRGYEGILAAGGARLAGDVLPDACFFAATAPREFLPFLLRHEKTRLQSTTGSTKAVRNTLFTRIRDTFEQEIAELAPSERIVLEAMFPALPYRRHPGDVVGTASKVTAEQIRAHLARWFAPTNATLVVVGDFDSREVLEQAREVFADVEWRDTPRSPEFSRPSETQIALKAPEIRRGRWEIAWRTRPLGQFENAGADVLMQRLCNPVDGTLAARLHEIGFESPVWRREAWRDGGMIRLNLERQRSGFPAAASRPSDGTGDAGGGVADIDIAKIVTGALRDAAAKPPTPVELNRARALVSANVRRRYARFHDRALELGQHEAVGGDVLLARFALGRPGQVRAGDIQSAATWLLETRSVWIEGTGAAPDKALRPAPTIGLREGGDPLALPGLEPIKRPLIVATGMLDSGIEIRACRLPGTVEACVQVYLGPDVAVESVLHEALAETLASDPRLPDYLSYHGIDLSVGRVGVRALGPPDRWEPMLEIAAKIVQRAEKRADWPAEIVGPVRIAVVSNEKPSLVVQTIRQHQQDWALVAPSTSVGASVAPSAVETEAAQRVALDSAAAIARRLATLADTVRLQVDSP